MHFKFIGCKPHLTLTCCATCSYAYTFTIPSESSTPGDVPGSYAVMVQLRTVDGASTL